MKTIQLKSNPAILAVVRKAFPSYRKHAVIVHVSEKVSLHGAHWSGGSRSYYSRVNLSTGESTPLAGQAWNENTSPEEATGKGFAIVESGIFCGKKATLVITFHPEDFSAFGLGS